MPQISLLFQIVFSAAFWAAAFAWMGVASIATFALLLVGFPYPKVHRWVTAPMFGNVVRLSGTRLSIRYHPDFDPQRPSLFCQNHVNLLDGHLASRVIPHAFSGLMNAWQMKIPIYGWLMKLSLGIPVRRARADKVLREISEAAKDRRSRGMSVLVFPEAHRTRDGRVHGFRRGVFMMAKKAELPVVSISVRGMFEVNRKGSPLFRPFRLVEVQVGRQYETAHLSDAQIGQLTKTIEAEVRAFVERDGAALSAGAEEPDVAGGRPDAFTS